MQGHYDSDYALGTDGKYHFADDTSIYRTGTYYVRSTNAGNTWSKPFRVSPKSTQAERGVLAASGNNLYVAYMTQTAYFSGTTSTFNPAAPRYIYVRQNTNLGVKTNWGSAVKLPGQTKTSRGDYLYIAASGSNVYVTTTNTKSGAIDVWYSNDSGTTWAGPVNVGTTTFLDNSTGTYVGGFSGLPAIATSGSTVGVAWTASPTGAISAVTCNAVGVTSCVSHTLATSGGADNLGYVQAAGDATRMAFTWTTASGGWLEEYSGGTWQPAHQFVSFPDSSPGVGTTLNRGGEGAIVALSGTTTVGIAISECNTITSGTCSTGDEKDREQLVYRQSADDGATWSAASIVATSSTSKNTFNNDFGSATFVNGVP